jgi:hypothetical protein
MDSAKRRYIKYSDNNWFAPWYVIDSLRKSVGTKSIKGHKEIWLAAMYAICHSSQDNSKWWVQFSKNDPPDARIMRKIEETDSLEILDVECFELSQFDTHESLMQSIIRKLTRSGAPVQYGKNTVVVGFLMRKGIINGFIDPVEIKQIKPNCGAIAILADEMMGKTTRSFIQLFPDYQKIIFDFKIKGKKETQKAFLCTHRKGTVLPVEDGEIVDVEMFPIPKKIAAC